MPALRDYDVSLTTRLGGVVNGDVVAVAVAGIAAPIRIHTSLPEDWYTDLQLPGIAVIRVGEAVAMDRQMPGFVGQELSTNPATPNTFNIQANRSQPVNLMYQVHIQAQKQWQINALTEHVLLALPAQGFGTHLSLYGSIIPFRAMGFVDRTDYETTNGRIFRKVATYTVEAWLASLDCVKVGAVTGAEIQVEVHPTAAPFVPPVAAEPTDPDLITVITVP